MRKLIIAAVVGLTTLAALPVAASAAMQERPYMQQDRNPDHRGPPPPPGVQRPGPDGRYGTWDDRWGARPVAPPRHWTRQNDWYRHVRACQERYRSYNPRTDTFVVRRGMTARCRL